MNFSENDRQFVEGVATGNLPDVWAAVDAGASVDTPIYAKHPLDFILTECPDIFGGNMLAKEELRYDFATIAGIIVHSSPDLFMISADGNLSTIDSILTGHTLTIGNPYDARHAEDPVWIDLAAKCVIEHIRAGIEKGRAPFLPDYRTIFTVLPPDGAATFLEGLKTIHSRVRQRLKMPESEKDVKVAAHTEATSFWVNDFAPPSADTLRIGFLNDRVAGICDTHALEGEVLSVDALKKKFTNDIKKNPPGNAH